MKDEKDLNKFKKRTVSSLFWKLLERGGNQAITLVVQIVLARILDPSDFGTIAIVIVFVNIGSVFVQSGLNTSLIQAPDVDNEDYSTVFFICLLIALILYVLIFAGAPFVETFYQIDGLRTILRIIALLLPIGALNAIQIAIVTRELKMKALFVATLSASLASGVLGISLAIAGFRIWALVAQQLSMQIVSCIVLTPLSRWHPQAVFSKTKAVRHFQFGWKLLMANLLHTAYTNLYDLIIGKEFSSADLGFFNQGRKIPQVVESLFDSTISSVMLSAASKVQSKKETLRALTRRAMQLTTFVVFPMMVFLAIAATPLIEIVFTDKWLPCVPFLQLFAIACALTPITTSNLQCLNAMGRSDVVLKLEIIKKSIATAILLFTSLAFGDMIAIAEGNLVYSFIALFINMGPLSKLLNYNRISQIKDVAPCIILSIASGAVSWFVGTLITDTLIQLSLELLVFIATYVALSVIFKIEAVRYLTGIANDLLSDAGHRKV